MGTKTGLHGNLVASLSQDVRDAFVPRTYDLGDEKQRTDFFANFATGAARAAANTGGEAVHACARVCMCVGVGVRGCVCVKPIFLFCDSANEPPTSGGDGNDAEGAEGDVGTTTGDAAARAQPAIDGTENIWIAKAGTLARGEGIAVFRDQESILEFVDNGTQVPCSRCIIVVAPIAS